jgi:molecular chaperone GrpE
VTAKRAERAARMADSATEDRAAFAQSEPAADLAALQDENASLRDRLLRALADCENTRKRAERTAADARQYAVSDFAREMLTVADNLQRSIAAAEQHDAETSEDAALIEGVRAIARMLAQIFERFGIRKIEAVGARFDPSLHEAVMEVEDASVLGGTVVGVAEDGYTLNDRLLRPARVIVAKRRTDEPPASDQAFG